MVTIVFLEWNTLSRTFSRKRLRDWQYDPKDIYWNNHVSNNATISAIQSAVCMLYWPVFQRDDYINFSIFFSFFFQIGFSGSSPLLSSKSLYPLYFRTNPSETFSNLGRIAILRRFNWKRVAILHQNNDVFTGINNSLVELLEAANVSVIAFESFKDHPRSAIQNLKVEDL